MTMGYFGAQAELSVAVWSSVASARRRQSSWADGDLVVVIAAARKRKEALATWSS
jgi:hypothetical protein